MTAGILAGGKSSRMGSSKSFLEWKGKTFLECLLEVFSDFPECLISVDHKERFTAYGPFSKAVFVEDVRNCYGPLEGIYRMLLQASGEAVFVLATDMPLVSREFVQVFADQQMLVDAVIVSGKGRIHPLCGIYRKSCIPVMEEMFERGDHSIMRLLELVQCRVIDVETMGFSPDFLANVNTREDYDEFREKWREDHEGRSDNIQ